MHTETDTDRHMHTKQAKTRHTERMKDMVG